MAREPREDRSHAAVRMLDERLSEAERRALAAWADELLRLRGRAEDPLATGYRALRVTYRGEVVASILSGVGSVLRDLAWADRSWTERAGVATLGALAVAGAGSAGAGAAVLGGAVGVPLWIVLGSGDAFARRLLAELRRPRGPLPPGGAGEVAPVVDGEWEFSAEPGEATGDWGVVSRGEPPARAPLWRVFRRAFRDARARQRGDGAGDGRGTGP